MKKKVSLLIFTIILMLVNTQVSALSLEKNALNISKGEKKNVKLYANLPEDTVKVEFTLVFDSYDIPIYFSPTNGITDETPNGIKHTLILEESSNGETLLGSVIARVIADPEITQAGADLHSAKAYDSEGNKTTLNSQNLLVKIDKKSEENHNNTDVSEEQPTSNVQQETHKTESPKTYNLLEEINYGDNKIIVLDNVFEYELKVPSDVKELDLQVTPKKDKYNVEISNQTISELIDNKIIITVTNGKEKQEYIINIKKIKETPKIEIDDTEFKTDNSHKGTWITAIIGASIGMFIGIVLYKNKK